MKSQYTKRQHIIPLFVLRNFADDSDLVAVIDKREKPFKIHILSPKSIMTKNDMYETRNKDGSYFERNSIEDSFAQIECVISSVIKRLINDEPENYSLSEEDKVYLALFMALQLVRSPMIKEMIISKVSEKNIDDNEIQLYAQTIYRMILLSDKSGFDYIEHNGIQLSDYAKNKMKGETLLSQVASYIISNCCINLIKTDSKSSFIISDNPILIDIIQDTKYIFPIAPNYAVCCSLRNRLGENNDGHIIINRDCVKIINQSLFENATRWVVFNKTDVDSISNQLLCISNEKE